MSNKSEVLIPKIIEATTREEAIQVLYDTMEALYLGEGYVELMQLKNRLDDLKLDFAGIESKYRSLPFPREYQQLAELRDEIAFIYRATNDDLSYSLNSAKIKYGEDGKTKIRAEAMVAAKENEELIKANNDKKLSLSSLETVYGITDEYKTFLNLYSTSYGLYQELIAFFAAMNRLSDSIASQAQHALSILNKDVK